MDHQALRWALHHEIHFGSIIHLICPLKLFNKTVVLEDGNHMKYVVMGNFTSLGAEKLAKGEKFCDSSSEPSRKFEVFPLVCKLAMIQV